MHETCANCGRRFNRDAGYLLGSIYFNYGVTAMLVVSAVHDFVLGPRAGRATAGSARAIQLRRQAAVLARINALLGVVAVVAAVRLARGG